MLGEDDDVTACAVDRTDALLDATTRSGAAGWRQSTLHRTMARDGAPLGHHAQTAHPRTHRRDHRRPHHQPARLRSAAAGTGTTATSGSATPGSVCTPCCGLDSPTKQGHFIGWLSERMGQRDGADDRRLGPLRVLYDIDGNLPGGARTRPPGAATATPGRCASATQRSSNFNSTSTARSSTRSTCSTSTDPASVTTLGATSATSSTGLPTTGTGADAGMWEVRDDDNALHHIAVDVLGGDRTSHPHRPGPRSARRIWWPGRRRATRSTSAS